MRLNPGSQKFKYLLVRSSPLSLSIASLVAPFITSDNPVAYDHSGIPALQRASAVQPAGIARGTIVEPPKLR
jgi:hypothetical protein